MGNDRIQRKLSKGKEQELNERDYYWDSLLDQYDLEVRGIEDTRGGNSRVPKYSINSELQ
jgi:hypothetical protein